MVWPRRPLSAAGKSTTRRGRSSLTCRSLSWASESPNPSVLLRRSRAAVASLLRSLTHTHHSRCKSSQLFRRSSSTVHARPCWPSLDGGLATVARSWKNSQSPWFGSVSTRGSFSLETGVGSGSSETESFHRVPVRRSVLSPRCLLLSRLSRAPSYV